MESNRICKGICKNFRVKKPGSKGRYSSGHALCITCDIWVDHNGCHLKNNAKATADSEGWFCDCCNFKVRRNPRNINYKAKIRFPSHKDDSESQIDLSYFNKRRALMIKKIVSCLTPKKDDFNMHNFELLLSKIKISISEIEAEFDESICTITDLAYTLDPPNKISMIAEFERIKSILQRIPTKQDMDKYSQLSSSQYDDEFESWEYLLERLGYDPFYRDAAKNNNDTNYNKPSLNGTENRSAKSSPQIDVDRLNMLIDKALRLIKSSHNGAYMSDIRMLLEISQEELSGIATRIVRIDGISKEEILHDGILQDVLFKYNESIEQNESPDELESENTNMEPENTNMESSDTTSEIESLVFQMINEYSTNKQDISKHLRQRLTKEFVELRSMDTIIKNNAQFSKVQIMRHVRTSLRMPERLREIEARGTLHSDPECSLQIALFAVNHYDWDGGAKNQDAVDELALSISKYLSQNNAINQLFKARRSLPNTKIQSGSEPDSQIGDPTDITNENVSTVVAIWVAVATLHRQYGIQCDFSQKDIILQLEKQQLCRTNRNTLLTHISSHCVANKKPNPGKHRKLYRVSRGRYKLYRKGDYYNPQRKDGQIAPNNNELPDKYKDLIPWYHEEYTLMIKPKTRSKQELSIKISETTKKTTYSDWSKKIDENTTKTQNWIEPEMIPQRDTVFTERELQSHFAVANSGGIRPSTKNRIIILVNSHFLDNSVYDADMIGYNNTINEDSGFVTYVGQGQNDQTMNRFNKSLMLSEQNGYVLLYFEKTESNKLLFRFPVRYDSHSFGKQKNIRGLLRRVILFKLKII